MILCLMTIAVFASFLLDLSPAEAYFNSSTIRLLTYTTPNSLLLTGLPFTGPALTIALEEVRTQYGLNLSNVMIGRRDLITCDDMVENAYLVPEYVYRHSKEVENFILLNPEWNIPILTSGTTYPLFYNVTDFPTTVSFAALDFKQLVQGLFDLFEHFAWTSVAVIHDVSKSNSLYSGIVKILSGNLATASNFTFFPIDTSSNDTIPYQTILDRVWPVSRITLLLMVAKPARYFMIAAQKMGRTDGDYVYICAEPFEGIRRFGNLTWQMGDNYDSIARTAFRSLLHLTGSCFAHGKNSEQTIMDRIKTDGIAQYNAPYIPNETTSFVAMASYYSVKALGEVLNEVIEESSDPYDGRDLAARFRNRTFIFNGRKIIISPNGVRVMEYCFRDMDMQSGTLEPVLSYDAMTHELRPIENSAIDWGTPGNLPPSNQPKCGFSGNNPVCISNAYWNTTLSVSVAVVMVVGISASLMITLRCLHVRREIETAKWWRMRLGDMNFKKEPKNPLANQLSTDAESDQIGIRALHTA